MLKKTLNFRIGNSDGGPGTDKAGIGKEWAEVWGYTWEGLTSSGQLFVDNTSLFALLACIIMVSILSKDEGQINIFCLTEY